MELTGVEDSRKFVVEKAGVKIKSCNVVLRRLLFVAQRYSNKEIGLRVCLSATGPRPLYVMLAVVGSSIRSVLANATILGMCRMV